MLAVVFFPRSTPRRVSKSLASTFALIVGTGRHVRAHLRIIVDRITHSRESRCTMFGSHIPALLNFGKENGKIGKALASWAGLGGLAWLVEVRGLG